MSKESHCMKCFYHMLEAPAYCKGHKTECPYKYCNLEAIRVSKEWSKMKTKLDIRIAKVGKIKVLNKAPIAPNKRGSPSCSFCKIHGVYNANNEGHKDSCPNNCTINNRKCDDCSFIRTFQDLSAQKQKNYRKRQLAVKKLRARIEDLIILRDAYWRPWRDIQQEINKMKEGKPCPSCEQSLVDYKNEE